VPARQRRVVVELVVRIPPDDDVAEAEALFEGGLELVAGHVLAAHDAIGVDDPDLDERQVAAAYVRRRVGGGLDDGSVHVGPSE
jgi:hypothetical protein